MFYELAQLSIHNLLRARARLLMTAGGVMIGTTAVVLLIALTIGLQSAAESSIGNNASLTQITLRGSFRRDSTSPTLNMGAVKQLASLPDVTAVIPELSLGGFVELRVGDLRGAAQIYGIYPATLNYLGVTAAQGTVSLDDDTPYGAVVGGSVSKNFTSTSSDTFAAQTVDLTSGSLQTRLYSQGSTTPRIVPLTVNAVLETGAAQDSAIYLPMNTVISLSERMTGNSIDPGTMVFSQIIVVASSRETAASVAEAITNLGYNATGTGSYLVQLNKFFGTLRVVLGGVGGVAMLVAAFGVANTMTMAILERTREIGLMKAIGATDRAIMTIFLLEAGMVGLLGGACGLAISYLVQYLANQLLTDLSFSFLSVSISGSSSPLIAISSQLALFAVGLATCIGIGAGSYPAMRAARMTTVVALKTD